MSESSHNDNDSERDARLTALYRAAPPDGPPAALDAAIMAAARREVGARPRPAGFAFASSWRTSLSIAAVLVLSVSLVTLMREEAPELTEPPRADMPAAESKLKAFPGVDDKVAPAANESAREEQRSKNIGLKPPQSGSPSGLGMRQPEFTGSSAQSKKDTAAGRTEADAAGPADLAKRRVEPATFADARDNKVAAAAEPQRQVAKAVGAQEIAKAPAAAPARPQEAKPMAAPATSSQPAGGSSADRMAENKAQAKQEPARNERGEAELRMRSQEYAPSKPAADAPPVAVAAARPPPPPAPVAKAEAPPVGVLGKLERADEPAPEKWLERIVELRRQGRFDEAKASLAEFRKRYPDYKLPEVLRDRAQP